MTPEAVAFYVLGALVLATTALAVTRREPMHAVVWLALSVVATALPARGEDDARSRSDANPEVLAPTAAVEVDGVALFRVRGLSSFSAERRADEIAAQIEEIAADPAISPSAVQVVEVAGEALQIKLGDRRLLWVFEADARLEGVSRRVLAEAHALRIREAIARYRVDRGRPALVRSAQIAAATLIGFALATGLLVWLFRRLTAYLESKYGDRFRPVGAPSPERERAKQVRKVIARTIQVVRTVTILVLALLTLDVVLGLFPWTRPIAENASGMPRPIETLAHAFLGALPSVLFLVVIFFGARYFLRFVELFFEAIDTRAVSFPGFEREWALPTYKILRFTVIALAVVLAYPHIPGSSTTAFKGLSLFLGIVFSLGSSSFVANIVAGYSVTYRRAYLVGDRVRIGAVEGIVTELRLQGTHIRTTKNEVVTVPNSEILKSDVVNYSTLAKEHGLILHATVGIGYGTPWRQVEAMLLLAADRTPGLLKEPPPFVRVKGLGDSCVTHEINVYSDDPKGMGATYSNLFRQILDVFNEYGVQIMTPEYYEEPEKPTVVPKEQWFLAPAVPPPSESPTGGSA